MLGQKTVLIINLKWFDSTALTLKNIHCFWVWQQKVFNIQCFMNWDKLPAYIRQIVQHCHATFLVISTFDANDLPCIFYPAFPRTFYCESKQLSLKGDQLWKNWETTKPETPFTFNTGATMFILHLTWHWSLLICNSWSNSCNSVYCNN